jgi:hypothetical protein
MSELMLTQAELKELEGVILMAWGESDSQTVMAALLIDVADTSKLSEMLFDRTRDLRSNNEVTLAKRLEHFAKKLGRG